MLPRTGFYLFPIISEADLFTSAKKEQPECSTMSLGSSDLMLCVFLRIDPLITVYLWCQSKSVVCSKAFFFFFEQHYQSWPAGHVHKWTTEIPSSWLMHSRVQLLLRLMSTLLVLTPDSDLKSHPKDVHAGASYGHVLSKLWLWLPERSTSLSPRGPR